MLKNVANIPYKLLPNQFNASYSEDFVRFFGPELKYLTLRMFTYLNRLDFENIYINIAVDPNKLLSNSNARTQKDLYCNVLNVCVTVYKSVWYQN